MAGVVNKNRWSDVTEAELAATGKVKRGSVQASRPHEKRATLAVVKVAKRFDYADTLKQQCALVGLPEPIRDHRGIPGRQFKMDLAWPPRKIYIEVDGGEWAMTNEKKSRHGHALGMQSDCIKQNLALLAGWKPYRVTGSQVESGYALGVIIEALKADV